MGLCIFSEPKWENDTLALNTRDMFEEYRISYLNYNNENKPLQNILR